MRAGVLRLLQTAAALRERIHRGQGSMLVSFVVAFARGMPEDHAFALAATLVVAATDIVECRVFGK